MASSRSGVAPAPRESFTASRDEPDPQLAARLLESVTDAVFALDRAWRLTYVNAAGEALTRRPRAALLGRTVWENFPASLGTAYERACRTAMARRTVEVVDELYVAATDAWIAARVYPTPDGIVACVRDITAAKRAERERRETEERFRQMAAHVDEVFYLVDVPLTSVLYVSPAFERVWGRGCAELYADAGLLLSLVHPEDRAARCLAAARGRPEGYDLEFRIVRPDGTTRWIHDRGVPVRDDDGVVRRIAGVSKDVTERRVAAEALREREAHWRALIENASDTIAVLGARGEVRYGSPALRRLLGFAPGELADTSALTRVHPDDARAAAAAFERLIARPDAVARMELRFRDKAGRWIALAVTAHNLLHDPAIGGIVCNGHDVTERRALEQRLRAMFEASPLATYVWQRAGDDFVLEDFNEAAVRITRGGVEALRGGSLAALFADTPQVVAQVRRAAAAPGRVHREELDYRFRSTGERRRIAVTYSAASADLVMVHTEDVTEQRRAEAEHLALADHVRLLLESTAEGIFGLDVAGRITFVNGAGAAALGYTPGEMVGRDAHALIHHHREDGAPYPAAECPVTRAFRDGEAARAERGVYWRRDGAALPVSFSASPVVAEGRLAGAVVAFSDETERRAAEAALRESEERYRLVSLATNHVVWDWDAATDRVRRNGAVASVFQYEDADDTDDRWWGARIHPEDAARVVGGIRAVVEGGGAAWSDEYRFRRGDGTYATVVDRGYVMRDAQGTALRMLGAMTDMTAQRQLEAQFRQAQKMEAIGRLAGGVAHDFNNLLTVIRANTEFLLEGLAPDDPRREEASEIDQAAKRAAALTRQLLAFSRRQVLAPAELDLNGTVREIGRMLRRLIGEDIELVLDLQDGLGLVMADPGQLEQVIVNLAVNARDAISRGGRLAIATANVDLAAPLRQSHVVVPPGAWVRLTVSDDGHGMDRATLERIFDPFFTTKAPGKGTGLGLSTVYGIVKQSEGFIWAESELGRGTTFRIFLPRIAGTGVAEPRAAAPASVGGTETVLLVEDEEGVRAIVRRILDRLGYTVLEAGNGREALEVLAAYAGRIDALLTDTVMPEMGGCELVDALRLAHPGLPVLYMSGYTDDYILRRGLLEAGARFLEKPFSAQGLARALREVLDARGATAAG